MVKTWGEGVERVDSPRSLSGAAAVDSVLTGARQLGTAYSAEWTSPTSIALTVDDAAGGAAAAEAQAGLQFAADARITDAGGTWLPGAQAPLAATWVPLQVFIIFPANMGESYPT